LTQRSRPGLERFESERLVFRPLTLDDVDALVELNRDPEVMRFINGGRPTPREDVEATVVQSLGHRWVALDRSTNQFIGWFGLRPTGTNEYELGYRLRREAWGMGFATEGARTLLATAFADQGARRVWAQTMTVNVASRRVMEKCGMRFVRTFHLEWPEPIEGTELGDVEYEMTTADLDEVRSKLIRVLQDAHAGELAAAYAYRAHWKSLRRRPEARAEVKRIEGTEWQHRRLVRVMLDALGARPRRSREVAMASTGRFFGLLCYVTGFFGPMYAAGRLEAMNVSQYSAASDYTALLGLHAFGAELEAMRVEEDRHERFFGDQVRGHFLLPIARFFMGWTPPPATD
jgi:RimJ/RimL family protein N-acetyltransferase